MLYMPLKPGKNYKSSLFAGADVLLYYKPHSYSISAGSGVNWRTTKRRI